MAMGMLRRHYGGTLPTFLRVLDLGCGDADLTCLMGAGLQGAGAEAQIAACDISSGGFPPRQRRGGAALVQADATCLPFGGRSFDGAWSFGYASVASYFNPSVQQELRRVLKPGGWLIADFRNHLSLWFVVFRPRLVAAWLQRFRGRSTKPQYHLSTLGLRAYFSQQGFTTADTRFLLSFPPLRRAPIRLLLGFERLCAVSGLRRPLGRVFLALLVRTDG